jgi:hypothetical protein
MTIANAKARFANPQVMCALFERGGIGSEATIDLKIYLPLATE